MKDQRKEKQRLKERRMKNTRKKAALRQKHPTVLLAVKSLPRFLSKMKNFQNIREEKMI